MWGVVLMTATFANGVVAYYGDPKVDTYSGWFSTVENCSRAAARFNEGETYPTPGSSNTPKQSFACMRKPKDIVGE